MVTRIDELSTPALLVDADVLAANLATMAAARPGTALRPHVKAHKCTELARRQAAQGHPGFTCATPREVLGMAAAGLGTDLLLANEVLDPRRLRALAELQDRARVTVAVDSPETVAAAAAAGLREVLVDVDVGLPRCGCRPEEAGPLADLARAHGLVVRGVMGYEGHLMTLASLRLAHRQEQAELVARAMAVLAEAAEAVGSDTGEGVVSAGGTGTYDLYDGTAVTEVQAGSYALMDTHYAQLGLPFGQALTVLGTVISRSAGHLVADVGLKALGMDHGDPTIEGARVWFVSDEHVTFAPDRDATTPLAVEVGGRVRVVPAHVDPTVSQHEAVWLVRGDEVLDRWAVDLRGW
jgi:D-serine deaminase-like pyridoxal phosphate-dependent protein